jgi:ribokinase
MEQSPEWDIVVVGGAYTDYVVRGPELPTIGETVRGKEFLILPGGKGANQAVAAARLGARRIAFVACVGSDDRGNEIIRQFQVEHVDTRYIVRDQSLPTGISLIQANEQGRKQMMVALGASQALTVDDVKRASAAITSTSILLTQLEIPLEAAMAAMRLAHEAGATVIFDPAPAAKIPDELFRLVDVIKPDAKEAEAITGIHVTDRDTAREAAHALMQRGVKAVVVQAGSQGDLAVWNGGERWLPRIPVKAVDATGAGDTLAGALAVAFVEGRSLNEAGPFASAAAALTTTKLGARPALPYRQQVEELLSRIAGSDKQDR